MTAETGFTPTGFPFALERTHSWVWAVGAGAVVIFVLYLTQRIAHGRLAYAHGCQAPARYAHRDPFLGLDSLRDSMQARKSDKYFRREQQLHQAYGNTFMSLLLGSWMVNTIEPKNLEVLFSTKFTDYEVGFRRRNAFAPLFGKSIFQSDGARWQTLRSQLQLCFSRVQTSQLGLLERHCQRLLTALPPDNQNFDLALFLHRFAADVSTDFLFGESINSLENPRNLDSGALKAFADTHSTCELRWLLGSMSWIWPQRTFMKNVRLTHRFIQRYVDAALQREVAPPAKVSDQPNEQRILFIDQLRQRTQDPTALRDELTTLYFAGTDAPAALLINLFFVFSKRPHVWDRVRSEVQSLGGKLPDLQQLKGLRYVQDCIRELDFGLNEVAYAVVRMAQNFKTITSVDPDEWVEGSSIALESKNGVKVAMCRDCQRGETYAGNVSINPAAYESINQSHAAIAKSLSQGNVIYGVNTGFGGSADIRANDVLALQRVLTRELSYGLLPPGARDPRPSSDRQKSAYQAFDLSLEHAAESQHLPLPWVRAAVLLRLNSLVKGHSGVRPVIVDRLRDLLSKNIIPMVPMRGSISASGDLSPIAYISGVLQGKPTIRVFRPGNGRDVYADEALAEAGVEPISLTAKEGLAIVNGTAMSAACATLVLHDTHQLAMLGQILTAMTVEALLGSPESFDPFFADVRPHPGQIESSRNIRVFLRGSRLAQQKDGKDGSLRQDRYSIRTAAQWIGPVLEDLLLAHQQISIECNSATDNPLVNGDGQFLHGGNFQAKAVTSSMEKSRQAVQAIGRMLFTQCQEMINPATSWGLPPNLVADEPSQSGIFKAIDIYISALTSELGFLAGPVNHVYNAELGNQSLNSLALISGRYTATAVGVLTELVAAHLLSACQALDLRAMQLQFLDGVKLEFFARTASMANKQGLNTEASKNLPSTLWAHLQKGLEQTVSMDSVDRFPHIAKTMRVPILDCVPSQNANIEDMHSFIDQLGPWLHEAWCANRDAYLVHGDASPMLGDGSKKMYRFVRTTLGVPMLCTRRILTPTAEAMATGRVEEAPTVGGYTSLIYRAIQQGEFLPVIQELLEQCLTKEELER
ncbi:hypothetical protein APSETT445_004766 [Aspergillus pseudonomiae]